MCIAVCPVGALTDRHFAHHPWELDSTETICGFCDVGCTINVESNKGIVRRVTNLWERGVNHGYLCEKGKWGHEKMQSPDRIFYPFVKDDDGGRYEVTWDDAIDAVADNLLTTRAISSRRWPRRTPRTKRSMRCSCSPARSWAPITSIVC